jgi:hypothetical protein
MSLEKLVDDVRVIFQDLPSTSQTNGASPAGTLLNYSRLSSSFSVLSALSPEPFPPLPFADLPALDAALQERLEQTKRLLSRLVRSAPTESDDLRQKCLMLSHEVPNNLSLGLFCVPFF